MGCLRKWLDFRAKPSFGAKDGRTMPLEWQLSAQKAGWAESSLGALAGRHGFCRAFFCPQGGQWSSHVTKRA